MGPQTDGPEWVLATLFLVGCALVVWAAIREFRHARRGDLGGDESERKDR